MPMLNLPLVLRCTTGRSVKKLSTFEMRGLLASILVFDSVGLT